MSQLVFIASEKRTSRECILNEAKCLFSWLLLLLRSHAQRHFAQRSVELSFVCHVDNVLVNNLAFSEYYCLSLYLAQIQLFSLFLLCFVAFTLH